MPEAVGAERILKDLARVWVDLGKQQPHTGSAGVLRACAMTLVVAVERKDHAKEVRDTIGELMREQPSRAIVLEVGSEADPPIEAKVFAQCWTPFGGERQICCEQIEISASRSRLPDLPKLVLALTVPDLPVVLWSRCPLLSAVSEFQLLLPIADKLIVDSAQFDDPERGRAYVGKLHAQGRNVADLAWTRLTRWRESIAHIFDDEQNRAHLANIQQVRITHAGDSVPVAARYLAVWLTQALPSQVELSFHSAPGQPGDVIRGIALEGSGFSVAVTLEDESATLMVNQVSRRAPFPPLSDCELLREELAILGTDPVFRRCLG